MTQPKFTDFDMAPPVVCPNCEQIQDGAMSAQSGPSPRAGDFAVCFNCAEFLVYDERLQLRRPHKGELKGAPLALYRVRAAVLKLKRRDRPNGREEPV